MIEVSLHRRKVKPMYIFCLRGDLNLQLKKKISNLQIKLLINVVQECENPKVLFTWSITSFFADLHIILAIRL